MTVRAMSGTTKSKTKNSVETSTWTITPAPKELRSGQMSMNQLLIENGFNPGTKEEMLMNDMFDENDQIAIRITKDVKKDFIKNLNDEFMTVLYPEHEEFLSRPYIKGKSSRAKILADDLFLKITSPREYFSDDSIMECKILRGDF